MARERFVGAYIALAVIAVAALVAVGVVFAFPPKTKTEQGNVKDIDNVALAKQLGKPLAQVDCQKLLGIGGFLGFVWGDSKNKRYVLVCAPGQ